MPLPLVVYCPRGGRVPFDEPVGKESAIKSERESAIVSARPNQRPLPLPSESLEVEPPRTPRQPWWAAGDDTA